jgi:AcrR family transcriptional regulator
MGLKRDTTSESREDRAHEPPLPGVSELIAGTALRLFAMKGYASTSVSEIVEAAGVTKPMLYYYFGSKEQLARQLVIEPLEKLKCELQGLERDVADPSERVIRWISSQLAFCQEDPDRARFVFALYFGPLGAELASAVSEFGQAAKKVLYNAALMLGQRQSWPVTLVEDYVRAIHGQMISTAIEILYSDPAESLLSVSENVISRRLVNQIDRGFFVYSHSLSSTSGESGQ